MTNSPDTCLGYENNPQPVLVLQTNGVDYENPYLELKPREWPRYVLYFILCTCSFFLMLGSALCFGFVIYNSLYNVSSVDKPLDGCSSRNDEWYYHDDWFIPLPGLQCECDSSAPITTILVDVLQVSRGHCSDTLSCLAVISFYLTVCNDWQHCRYGFYLDTKGNVFAGRNWGCSAAPGKLWVAILVNGNNTDIPPDHGEIQRIMTHFTSEVSEYAIHCSYYNPDRLDITYPNTTTPVTHDKCPFTNGHDYKLSD